MLVSRLCVCDFSHPVFSLCSPEAWKNQEKWQLGGSHGLGLDVLLKDQLQFLLYLLQGATVYSQGQSRKGNSKPTHGQSAQILQMTLLTVLWILGLNTFIDVNDEGECHRGEFCSNSEFALLENGGPN